MNSSTKTGLVILEAGLLLGILSNVLLRNGELGLNVALCGLGLAAVIATIYIRRKPEMLTREASLLLAVVVFFTACFAWRSSPQLLFLDALGGIAALSVLTLPAMRIKPQTGGVVHFFIGFIWSAVSAAFSPFTVLLADISWKSIPQTGWTKHLIAVLRGVAIAAPILFIFTALFMAADAVFEGIIEKTLHIEPDVILSHIALTGFFSWAAAGYLRASLKMGFDAPQQSKSISVVPEPPPSVTDISDSPETKDQTAEEQKSKWNWQEFSNEFLPGWATLGAVEVTVMLGLINLLFLGFVIVQIPYLFGGFELVQQTDGLKLADYARRGFGELVAVAALVLPILLVSHWLLRKDGARTEWIFRVLAGIQIGLLFVIMASAMQRLFILTGNLGYGLTTVRFYPMVFMIWLAMVFAWFAVTVLRGARTQFAWGALWSAFFMLATLNFVNPDAYIASTNVKLMQQGREFDEIYNINLSHDAVPVLVNAYNSMNDSAKCAVRYRLRNDLRYTGTDIRGWNLARAEAREIENAFANGLDLECDRLDWRSQDARSGTDD